MSTTRVTYLKEGDFYRFKLELDPEQNAGSSSFKPGQTAYIRLFPAGLNPELKTSMGTATIVATRIPLDVEEYITFARGDSASLNYPEADIELWEWKGRKGPSPVFAEEGDIQLPEKFSGILYVKYRTYYDRIAVTCPQEGKVLLEAIKPDRYGYIVVDYKPRKRRVYLTVRDACTRTVIAGAHVYLDGQFVGLTNDMGRIDLGELDVGTHNIKVVKAGYTPTDEDNIANDSFTVPEPEE